MQKLLITIIALTALLNGTLAQHLKPGFDKAEFIDMLKIGARFGDSAYFKDIPEPKEFKFIYRSSIIGFDNLWDLWTDKNSVAVISIRGTSENSVSWLANFYSAMVPAKGELYLSGTDTFQYELASNPKAAVHVGWLISMAFLSKDILIKIDSCYKNGIKEFIIAGHSQGGGIAYLLTAYLYNLQKQNALPADICFKTYCSAAPKPGNLYFAYDYEAMTQNGWAYNVVNSADWVPEVPISIQTLNDFNTTNPFIHPEEVIKKQKFPNNLVSRYIYNRLYKPTFRAQKNYQKYLGNLTAGFVKENIKGFIAPAYYSSNNYVRTGTNIVLLADDDYFKLYPDNDKKIFLHHFHQPYLYLAEKLADNSLNQEPMQTLSILDGTWELNYISGRKIAFSGLFPEKKPVIIFDIENNKISGNTSCNNFSGNLNINENKISFADPLVMTKMMCEGEGEQVFLETLKSVTSYSVENDILTLIMDDIAVMKLIRR
jgi:heat shock protein HslJ